MIHVICIGNTTIPRDSCDLYRFYDNSYDACALYKVKALFNEQGGLTDEECTIAKARILETAQ